MNGSLFDDFITQARTDRYNIMWSLVAHEKENSTSSDDESSLGERNVPKKLPTDTLKSLSAILKLIDEWLLMFPENYDAKCEAYKTAMGQLFKTISVTSNNLLTQKQRYTKTIENIGGQWFIKKHAKGIPPLKINTLGKKAQQKHDEIKSKLYDANRWWNDCKFQLHWHMLEWVTN